MAKITNIVDLGKEYDQSETDEKKLEKCIERVIYKHNSCGPWITFTPKSITVGSIVEGVDYGTDSHTLKYPFTSEQLDDIIEQVQEEADDIWNDTHGCDDCGEENPDTGSMMINPNCKTCKGEGMII